MVVMKRFFFWFSVRFGTVIVGILSLIQAAVWLMISLITIKNQEDVREFLQEVVESLGIQNKHFLAFVNDPHIFLIILAVFISLYLISCVMIIVGALVCKQYKLLYPFIVLDLIYIKLVLLLLVMLLINFKKRGYGLGALILYSNLSAVFLIILIYLWACVLSLLQIINELRCEIAEHRILLHDGTRQMKRMIDMRYRGQPNQYETTE